MDVQRKGCGNLNAALGRLRLRTAARRVVDSGGIDVLGVELRGQVLGRLGVLVGDPVRFALVEQIAHILAVGVQRIVAAGNHLVVVILRAAVGIRLARRRAALRNRAVGARQNLLVETAHAGRLDEHAGGILHPALHGRVCGVIQDRDAERAAKADRAAHGRRVHHHVPDHAAVGAHSQPAGELQRLIRAAQIRLSSQTADGQRQHGHNRPAAGCTGRRLHMLLARIVRNHGKGLKRAAAKADAVLDHGRHINAGQADRDARADAGRAAGEAVRRSERNLNARDGEAAPRALAGGIANRDVIAAADRLHAHRTASYIIGSVFPDQRIGNRLRQMNSDRAAQTEVRSFRDMACLHDDGGRGVSQIGIHVEPLCGNLSIDDFGHGFLTKQHHADASANRVVDRLHAGCARDVVKRWGLIERTVRAQIGYRLPAGIHDQRLRRSHCAAGVHARRRGRLNVSQSQRTHQLGRRLSAGRFRLRRLGCVSKQISQAVGARSGADDLAKDGLVFRLLHAQNHFDKGHRLGHRIAARRVRSGHADRNRVRKDPGGGIQPDMAQPGENRSVVENLDLCILLNEAARDEDARPGLKRKNHGRLARGKGGRSDKAVRNQIDVVLRLHARVALNLHRGVNHGQRQGDGELRHAARRVRSQPCVGERIQLNAGSGRNPGILRHRDQSAAAGCRHSDRHNHLQRAVGRVDADIQLAADAHRAERVDLAQHVHRSLAELQHEGVEFDDPRIRDEALVQREACQHIQRAIGHDVRILRNLNLTLAFRLIEAEIRRHVVFLIQIVRDDAELAVHDHVIRADGMQQDILADHIAGHLDVSAGDDQVEIRRLNLLDLDSAFLVLRGRDDVRQEQAVLGHDQEIADIQAQRAVRVLVLDNLRAIIDDLVIGKGLRLHRRHSAFQKNRALVQQRIGKGVHAAGCNGELLFEAHRQHVVQDGAQEGDLRQRVDRDLHIRADGARRDALVLIGILVQLAGDVQAVKAVIALHIEIHAADEGKGRRGIDGHHVVAASTQNIQRGRPEVLIEGRDMIDQGLNDVLTIGERAAAGDLNPVVSVIALNGRVDSADIHVESIGDRAIRIELAHQQIRAVNELDLHRIVTQTQVDVQNQRRSAQLIVDLRFRIRQNIGHQILKLLGHAGHVLDAVKGALHAVVDAELDLDGRLLLGRDRDPVVALAGIDMHRLGHIAHVHFNHVVLRRAIIGDTVRILDVDHAAGGKIQTRQHDIQALEIDVDVALNARGSIAIRRGISVLIKGVLSNDVDLDVALRIALIESQNLIDQDALQAGAALFSFQINAALIGALRNHDGRFLLGGAAFAIVE